MAQGFTPEQQPWRPQECKNLQVWAFMTASLNPDATSALRQLSSASDDHPHWINGFLLLASDDIRLQKQLQLDSLEVVTPDLHLSTHCHSLAWPQSILDIHVLLQALMPWAWSWHPQFSAIKALLVRAELSDCFGGWKLEKSIIVITITIIVKQQQEQSRTRGQHMMSSCAAGQPTAYPRGSQPWAIWTGLLCTACPAMGASCPGAARAHWITQQAPTSSSALVK